MLSTRWQPFLEMQSEMGRLREEFDRLFGRAAGRRAPAFTGTAYPPLNVWEDDNNLYVEAELPGLELSDLEIFVNGNQLTVNGERQQPGPETVTWHRRERGFGKFSRTFELPGFADAEKVGAELKCGVLTITLPKREESKPRRIEVKGE